MAVTSSNPLEDYVTRRYLPVGAVLLAAVVTTAGVVAQARRDIGVTAVKHQFKVSGGNRAEISVTQDDLVRITLTSEDVPHSFTLPDYRIQKRVEPGREVTFEFRAEKAGRFEFHCSLTADNCRERGMVGALIVAPR
jgi:heme/copper-type cytochrome/quinol oxidase subunit 2